MKDYTTWWDYGDDVSHELLDCYGTTKIAYDESMQDFYDNNCILEQLWAIREGLA